MSMENNVIVHWPAPRNPEVISAPFLSIDGTASVFVERLREQEEGCFSPLDLRQSWADVRGRAEGTE